MSIVLAFLCAVQDPEALRKEAESLAIKTPWSKVEWKTCLLEACAEGARQKKPVLLWALGGDPEGRC